MKFSYKQIGLVSFLLASLALADSPEIKQLQAQVSVLNVRVGKIEQLLTDIKLSVWTCSATCTLSGRNPREISTMVVSSGVTAERAYESLQAACQHYKDITLNPYTYAASGLSTPGGENPCVETK